MSIYKRLKNHFDIVDIATRYLDVEQRGSNFFAKCFHGENTASLSISPYKKMFTCFGCGLHGDIIDLVMYGEGCTHNEAVRTLAEEAGIPYASNVRINPTIKALELVSKFTHTLASHTSDGDLLTHMSADMVDKYNIGILTPDRDLSGLLLENELTLPFIAPESCILLPIYDSRGVQGFFFYEIETLALLGWYIHKPVLFYADSIVLAKIKFHLQCTITDNPLVVAFNKTENIIACIGDISQAHISQLKSYGLLKVQLRVTNPIDYIKSLHHDFSIDVVTSDGEVLCYLDYIRMNHPEILDDYIRGSHILQKYYKKEINQHD